MRKLLVDRHVPRVRHFSPSMTFCPKSPTIPQMFESPDFHLLDELLQHLSPRYIYASGWAEIFPVLGILHNANSPRESSTCSRFSDVATLAGRLLARQRAQVEVTEASLAADECAVERLVVEVGNAVKEGVVDVSELKSGLPSLHTLLGSSLPVFDVLTLLRFPEKVDIGLKASMDWMPEYASNPAVEKSSFRITLLPFREMASEYVRFTRQPFCSTHSFRTFMNKLATTAVKTVNIVEGGPNLGDCGLWAASLMRATNKTATVTFVEPLPHGCGHQGVDEGQ